MKVQPLLALSIGCLILSTAPASAHISHAPTSADSGNPSGQPVPNEGGGGLGGGGGSGSGAGGGTTSSGGGSTSGGSLGSLPPPSAAAANRSLQNAGAGAAAAAAAAQEAVRNAMLEAPAAGHRVVGAGEDNGSLLTGQGRLFGAMNAPAAPPAPKAADSVTNIDKVVGEIATLPDSRTASQKQAQALLGEAQTQLTVGRDPLRALGTLTDVVRLDPANILGWIRRAEVDSKLKHYDDALADAKEAIRLDTKNGDAWDQAAWAQFRAGRYQDAIDAATRALFLNPNDAVALAIRSRAKWALGDRAGALADAQAAAQLDLRFRKLSDAMAKGDYANDDDLVTADDAAKIGEGGALPWTTPLALGALLLVFLGLLGAWLTRKGLAKKIRTFSSLARPDNGRLAGKYELKRMIGKGGMGNVYEAFDHSLKRIVAVKKMAAGLAEANPKAKELLVREAQTVAALHHPNIVDIYEILDDGKDLYLVFELVRGRTVTQLLAEGGPLPLARAAELLRPVCQALELAHARELVHRDLKPANIMLTDDGFVKLMDFGIARSMGVAPLEPGRTPPRAKTAAAPEIPLLAHTKMVMGTPYYMAPEMEYGVVCKEGDVYALGVCLYEMLTARFPFETSEQKAQLAFVPPSRLVPGLTRRVDQLLLRALQPDPAKRTRTPGAFYNAVYAAAQPGKTPPAPVLAV